MEMFEQLEREFAAFNGLPAKGMVCCNSGTSALHLALEVLGLPPGSRVIVPSFTMISCPRAVRLAGLELVFIDCRDDLLMDLQLAAALQESTDVSAVMPVHIYGRRCPMNWPTTKETHWRIKVIEDLAEAHGVRVHPSTDAACWSFYRNKIIAGEEGGAVWFRDPEHAALARQLRCLGFTPKHDFTHLPRGHNYRLANSLASLVLTNLRRVVGDLDGYGLTWRREVESWYEEACPSVLRMPRRDVPWVYDVRLPGIDYDAQARVVEALQREGIAARCAFKPMEMQPEFRRDPVSTNSLRLSKEVIYLPINRDVTREMAGKAFEVVARVLGV